MLRNILLVALGLACVHAFANDGGYVLHEKEGEDVLGDRSLVIKASPQRGTQGMVVVEDIAPAGATSGIHVHLNADEVFYVVRGRGRILIGEEEHEVKTGDFAFVPVGVDHRVTSSKDDPLVVYEIVDRPGLDEVFRHGATETTTLESRNAIAQKYGTIYKTVD